MARLKCFFWEYVGFAKEASPLTEQVLTGQRDDADIDPTLSSRSTFAPMGNTTARTSTTPSSSSSFRPPGAALSAIIGRPRGQSDDTDIDDALFGIIVRPKG